MEVRMDWLERSEDRWADRIDAIDRMYERDIDRGIMSEIALNRMQADKIEREYAEYAAEQRQQSLIRRMLI
jgi:hypothetical protein